MFLNLIIFQDFWNFLNFHWISENFWNLNNFKELQRFSKIFLKPISFQLFHKIFKNFQDFDGLSEDFCQTYTKFQKCPILSRIKKKNKLNYFIFLQKWRSLQRVAAACPQQLRDDHLREKRVHERTSTLLQSRQSQIFDGNSLLFMQVIFFSI